MPRVIAAANIRVMSPLELDLPGIVVHERRQRLSCFESIDWRVEVGAAAMAYGRIAIVSSCRYCASSLDLEGDAGHGC